MKITKNQLKQMIQEGLTKMLNEERRSYKNTRGKQMKITKAQLQQIIQEEVAAVLKEALPITRGTFEKLGARGEDVGFEETAGETRYTAEQPWQEDGLYKFGELEGVPLVDDPDVFGSPGQEAGETIAAAAKKKRLGGDFKGGIATAPDVESLADLSAPRRAEANAKAVALRKSMNVNEQQIIQEEVTKILEEV